MKRQCIVLLLVAVMAVSTSTAVGVTTATKADAATPNYSSSLNNAILKGGYKLVTPFKKTRVYGRGAYVGAARKNGFTYHIILFPMNTRKNALSYRDQLIDSYRAQGFRQHKIEKNGWMGLLGNAEVWIMGSGASHPLGNRPATLLMTGSP